MIQKRHWIQLSIILFLALLTRILCATPAIERAGALRPRPPVLTEPVGNSASELWLFQTGLGGAAAKDRLGWAVSWGLYGRAVHREPWFAGLDLGLHYWGESPFTSHGTAFGISVLPGILYRFVSLETQSILPYLGLSMGVQLRSHSGGNYLWYWQTVARGGLEFSLNALLALGTDIRVGLVGTDFVFLPQINGIFRL